VATLFTLFPRVGPKVLFPATFTGYKVVLTKEVRAAEPAELGKEEV